MLDKIKSSYVLKEITSFLNENIKLELFKYSKNKQNRLNINIKNYITFGGKYKIGNKNGKGKEYNCFNDKLIF